MKTYLSIDLDYWFANGDGDINDLYRMLYTIYDRPSIEGIHAIETNGDESQSIYY